MASLFPPSSLQRCTLLDAGAGVGALTCAFLDRWAIRDGFSFDRVGVEAYEIDPILRGYLEDALASYAERLPVGSQVFSEDFIEAAALQSFAGLRYTHAILNPPYKKINSLSQHRLILRQVGIETVNLYSAFVALALSLMKPGGQLVAIIPRSFCNGPYYRPFREYVLHRAALRHLHLFDSRTKAFKDDDVLQENVIMRLECGGVQGTVTVSNSTDDSLSDLVTHEQPFDRIVFPDDSEKFIHVPTSLGRNALELPRGRFPIARTHPGATGQRNRTPALSGTFQWVHDAMAKRRDKARQRYQSKQRHEKVAVPERLLYRGAPVLIEGGNAPRRCQRGEARHISRCADARLRESFECFSRGQARPIGSTCLRAGCVS